MDGIDVIYWINLDRSTLRKKSMETLFKDKCFNCVKQINRITAIDGKHDNLNKYLTIINKNVSDNEYACLTSHLESIKTFAEDSNHNIAMICEDDITLEFKKYWKNNLSKVINDAPIDWEIIMLCYQSKNIPIDDYTLNVPKGTYSDRDYFSSACYIINKKGAVRLMNRLLDYNNNRYIICCECLHVPDILLFHYCTTYVYKYPYFIYKYNEKSTIATNGGRDENTEFYDYSKYIIESMYIREHLLHFYLAIYKIILLIIFAAKFFQFIYFHLFY